MVDPAILQLMIKDPDRLIDREDGRSRVGRLQLRAQREGHLALRPDNRNQWTVTEAGRAALREREGE